MRPDCVLLDYMLPDMTGLEFLKSLCSDQPVDSPGFAVVVLTGLASEQVAVEAMKAGAQDYLVKDRITAEGLGMAIEKATEKVGLIRALKAERDHLARSLAEKEVLLKEVHHRVKNNLQVIASLLRLKANRLDDERLALVLSDLDARCDARDYTRCRADREVDLANYASMLATNLFHSYAIDSARVSFRVAIPPLPLSVDRAIPAGLILNELLSNALKHAFPENRSGSVLIEGGRQNGTVVLAVRDDGVGIPEGVEPRRSGSLGLEIVTILSRQLKGVFEWERGHGTTFRVSFPES